MFREATPTESLPGTRRFALDLPWQNLPNWGDFRVRISSRGSHLAYPGSNENRTTIYLRPLDSLEAIALVSPAADPWSLEFSPDSEQLAFFIGRHLQAVSIHGGLPEPLGEFSEEQSFGDISWGSDGSILLGGIGGLTRVRTSDGGADLVVAARDEAEVYVNPFHLPDANHALVSITSSGVSSSTSGAPLSTAPSRPAQSSTGRLAVVDLVAGTVRELTFQGVEPIYSPTGHVLFRQGDELFAFAFDLDLKLGSRSLVSRAGPGPAGFPIWHPNGQLATFAQGDALVARMADGSGAEERLLQHRETPTSWSPDGEHLAFFDDQSDVWMLPTVGDANRSWSVPPTSGRRVSRQTGAPWPM